MDIISLLNDKSFKATEKRKEIAEALSSRTVTVKDIQSLEGGLDGKQTAIILEAMEAVTGKTPESADLDWLLFAEQYITADSNSLKRESSRIVGNIAHLFPNDLEKAIQKLLDNSGDGGTVVRWGSAYALGRIVVIPQYANGELFGIVGGLCERESDNGVKNQYLNGLKKAGKIRG